MSGSRCKALRTEYNDRKLYAAPAHRFATTHRNAWLRFKRGTLGFAAHHFKHQPSFGRESHDERNKRNWAGGKMKRSGVFATKQRTAQ